MRRIKRILAVPIILILDLLKIVINLLIKAECWVAGVEHTTESGEGKRQLVSSKNGASGTGSGRE